MNRDIEGRHSSLDTIGTPPPYSSLRIDGTIALKKPKDRIINLV